MRICSVDGCDNKHNAKGYCYKHYKRNKLYGDPLFLMKESHGLYNHTTYAIWQDMRQRCKNPNSKQYADYGGRGIKVCERWDKSFIAFLSDMGHPEKGLTLERKNNNGNYEQSNCKWETRRNQLINQRIRKDNTSGHKGVSFCKTNKRWVAYINGFNGRVSLGSFVGKDDAIKARLKGELIHFKE